MGTNWLGGAKIIKAVTDGGSMLGGTPRVTWHTTENNPKTTSAAAIARYLNGTRNTVHIVWNPVTGEIVQMIPANRAGRGLKNVSGGVQTNRAGSVNIQIEVVARATEPFTQYECKNLDVIVKWLRSHGVKDVFPGGSPKPYPASYGANGDRSVTAWRESGHFGHSQVPENSHGDPGAINTTKILRAGVPSVAKPSVVAKPSFGNTYKVAKGDTLWEIAAKFKVTVAALKAANKKKDELLLVGEILKVPTKIVAPNVTVSVAKVQYGKFNTDVRHVQGQLRKTVGLSSVDGDFGPKTKAAVKRFQAKIGVSQTGVVTKSLLQALGFTKIV